MRGLRGQHSVEIPVARAVRPNHESGWRFDDFVELAAIDSIRNDKLRVARLQAMLDRLGPEGREKRLIDGTRSPDSHRRDKQFRRTRQHDRDDVTGFDVLLREEVGETSSTLLQLDKGQ